MFLLTAVICSSMAFSSISFCVALNYVMKQSQQEREEQLRELNVIK